MNTTRLAATISIALALAACMTSPPAPTDTYYRLRPGEIPAAGVSQLPMSLHVQRFTADGLLRERAMLYSDDDGHRVLKQHVYHYWLDNPARLLHDYWTAQLQGSNPMQVGQSSATDYALHGRLRRMERLLSPDRVDVALSLELSLRNNATGRNIVQRRYDVVEPATSDRVVDSVKAYEAALQLILVQFIADVRATSSQAVRDL